MKTYIYETRKKLGLTLGELSEMTGLSSSDINEAENGVDSPTLNTICKLAKAMNVTPKELFTCDNDDYIY